MQLCSIDEFCRWPAEASAPMERRSWTETQETGPQLPC